MIEAQTLGLASRPSPPLLRDDEMSATTPSVRLHGALSNLDHLAGQRLLLLPAPEAPPAPALALALRSSLQRALCAGQWDIWHSRLQGGRAPRWHD